METHEAPRSFRTHPLPAPPSPMEWDASPPLGLGKLCQHNFGHNSIVGESSNAGTIAFFFQHKENYNQNNHNISKLYWEIFTSKCF